MRKYWTHSPHIPPTNCLSRDVIDGQIFKIFNDAWKRDERQSQSSNKPEFLNFHALITFALVQIKWPPKFFTQEGVGGELRNRLVVRLPK